MRNILLALTIFCLNTLHSEVVLSIGNFNDTGSSITFDIMMTNTEAVQGFQFDLSANPGSFTDNSSCVCTAGSNQPPSNCSGCYYDYGVDKLRNALEEDTATSGYSYGCEDFGVCTDSSLTSTECEDDGECSSDADSDNSGTTSDSECAAAGSCSISSELAQCGCEYAGGVWTSDDLVWTPDHSYMPYNTPVDCLSEISSDDDPYHWDYYNPDGNNDNYASLEDQFCHVPEFNGDFSSSDDMHDPDESVAGHCSQYQPVCVAVGGSLTGPGTDYPVGTVLNWSSGCCNVTQGGRMFYPYRDKDVCEGTVEIFGTTYDIDTEWTWTNYADEDACDMYGGTWSGSENGTDGNLEFDEGEYFYQGAAGTFDSFLITTPMDLMMEQFIVSGSGSRAIGFSLGGYQIPASDTPVAIANVSASYSGIEANSIYEIFSTTICGKGVSGAWTTSNCPSIVTFSDGFGQELDISFETFIWTVGSGGTVSTTDDGYCASVGGWGEDSESDSSCIGYCGDSYCGDGEDYLTCSVDCSASCGDDVCDLYEEAETAVNCPSDCSLFGCGDFICSEGETSSNCPYDCFDDFCGDGLYDYMSGESFGNCSADYQMTCGDGYFDFLGGETYQTGEATDCDQDYGGAFCGDGVYDYKGGEDQSCVDYVVTCGDGIYDWEGGENLDGSDEGLLPDCVDDYVVTCGDGIYDWEGGENLDGSDDGSEPDCDYVVTCGDSYYDYNNGEDQSCADYIITSGDGYCDALDTANYVIEGENADAENPGNEEACPSSCGDGFYDYLAIGGSEDQNCADYVLVCNDGYCDEAGGEDYVSCPVDGCYTPANDNGVCDFLTLGENFWNNPLDCQSYCGDLFYDHPGIDMDNDGQPGTETQDCVEDYVVTCGDGVYDYTGGENLDGVDIEDTDGDGIDDLPTLPDCSDYVPTCGDGVYDWSVEGGELPDQNTGQEDADAGICDYVMVCGDGFCDFDLGGDGSTYEVTIGDDGATPIVECEADCSYLSANDGAPFAFSVDDNFPNPFNPTTTINYTVAKAGDVQVKIYDIRGQEVYKLVDGFHMPGVQYSATWNALNQSNRPISTGIYFYEVRSLDDVKRFKMAFVK